MSHHYRYLSKLTPKRHITLCSHNVVHLTWDQKTLHMHPRDFWHVSRFVEYAARTGDTEGGDRINYFARHENGRVQLWLLGMGLYLSPVDLLLLTDMVRTAAENIANPPDDLIEQGEQAHHHVNIETLHAATPVPTFSLN